MRHGFSCGALRSRAQKWLIALVSVLGLPAGTLQAQEAVCAEVRIQIQQRLSLERQAFDAVLKINNGLVGIDVENLAVDITFVGADGLPVVGSTNPDHPTASFFIRLDDLDGVGGVDGTGSVAGQTSSSIRWLIIPSADAGGESEAGTVYGVGATVSYTVSGEDKTLELTPELITVRPQPRLHLEYFLPFDVHGDDPFTPQIEPSEPFPLGVRIRNVGFGEARDLTIESAQPQIIENEMGLLVNFEILGGYVQDEPSSPSMLLNFGQLDPGSTSMGRWEMITSLSGQFRQMEISYTHADTLGGPLTSLIANPNGVIPSHRLIKDVIVNADGRDAIRDFLAYPEKSSQLRVYESDGSEPLEADDLSDDANLSHVGGGAYGLSVVPPPTPHSLIYVKLASPYGEQRPQLTVTRGDGSPLPQPNVWVSKERVDDNNGQLSWDYYVNVFDAKPESSYTIAAQNVVVAGEINGRVYVDHGLQDPDLAPPLPGVAVLLEGTTFANEPISRMSSTANLGRFRFGDVPAGNYELQVAAVEGHTDGKHGIGNAGGTAIADRITGIELANGQIATGYSFVKLPIDSADEADLALSMQGPTGPVTVGEVFPVTLTLSNAGPESAQAASVNVNVPAGLVLQAGAEPTVGTFHITSGTWLIDELGVGASAVLTVNLVATAPNSYLLAGTSMHLAVNVVDPDLNNNAASVSFEAEHPKSQLTLAAGLAEQRQRVLALITCGQIEDANAPPCDIADVHLAAGDLLDDLGVESMITASEVTFLAQLRSGYWNTYWISSAANPNAGGVSTSPALPNELVDELAAYIHAGDTLLVEGGLDQTPGHIEQLLGSYQFQALYSDDHAILVEPTSPLPMGEYQLDGYAFSLLSSDTSLLASFAHRAHAATEVDRSHGRAIVLGFRLIDMPIVSERMLLAAALFDRLAPVSNQEASFGDEIRIGANVGNGATPSQFTLTMQAQGPDLFLAGDPLPSTVTFPSANVTWMDTFVADTALSYVADLQLLAAPAMTGIDVTLVENSTSHQLSESITIQVLDAGEFVTRAHQALAAEQLIDIDEIAAQSAGLTWLTNASSHISTDAPVKAKDALITAMDAIAQISSIDLGAVRSDIGKAIRVLNRFIDHKRASACPEQEPVSEASEEPGEQHADALDDADPQLAHCERH